MRQYKMLVLTDHTGHSKENSLYPLVRSIKQHPRCQCVDVASRGLELNTPFFKREKSEQIYVAAVDDNFVFSSKGDSIQHKLRKSAVQDYDVVWLRMPPPLSKAFLDYIVHLFPNQVIINDPKGIYETGSKAFLTKFPDLCPPMKECNSIEEIINFSQQFPIVLKPYRAYGGKGIVKIENGLVWVEKRQMSFDEFIGQLKGEDIAYLGVKYLQNVVQGDKRIIVVNGKIMGASLRLPAEGAWLCNVAMGGSSHYTEADQEEIKIVEHINPILTQMGIVMYGVDTLMGDDGKRVLSEINTTSIGGLPQIAQLTGEPRVRQATDLIWDYIIANT